VAPQVDPAVADPGHLEAAAVDPRRHHRGAHRQAVAAALRATDDLLVGDPDRLRQRGAAADLADDGLARQRAGDFAVFMAAHAVGNQPQPEFAVAVVGVLVELPAQAHMAEMSEFDHAGETRPGLAWETGM